MLHFALDIDELKRDILELETKIRTAKQFIRSELLNLRNEEITLMEKEVQKFHEFMKNSPNRYGGWNEYNHNAFIQIWNKYYGDNNEMIAIKSIEDTFSYQYFKEEVLHKISGSSGDSIDSHSKWYLEFLHLKLNQQRALIKWQENKKKIKPSRKARLILTEGSPVEDIKSPTNIKLCRKQNQCNVTDRNINNRRNRTTFGMIHII
ncbi:jg1284 [Pararge aegeria aegeria]|uniref:Jg1284 protein n=1 Tax=Pararge aegeria aegeria TaxID=348720 RepID=A0A8S4RDU9_9NEOP|nr:jg1284 [Pararge aegeria aegeria]